MSHPFVMWLLDKASIARVEAERCRNWIKGNSPEALSASADMSKWIEEYEASAVRLTEWARMAEDMISCGLEELALKFYDAKRKLEPALMPPRPDLTFFPKLDAVMPYIEERIKTASDSDELDQLRVIETTMLELFETGMTDMALTYYQRKSKQQPELDLPDPSCL